ncbi:hypothetical protein [Roseibium sp.]|uniref:hypothetical protein n=1 Tax=Roseibium sp. TaxID=1936156 RepID=UPI003D1010FC
MNRRQFLAATTVLGLGIETGLVRAARSADMPIRMRALYNKDGSFSDLAQSLEGQRITVDGFMAPPLKADIRFFVLTKKPLAVCPFCETEAEWPEDILAIYTKRSIEVVSYTRKILTRGLLELGAFQDPDTGFASRVRLTDAVYERA